MKPDHGLVLYGSTTSPFVRKVRVALLHKRMAHRFELAPPWSAQSVVGTLNPLHKVPVLVLEDGSHVFDSRVIIQYLEARQPDPSLLPASAHRRIESLQIEALADGIGDAAALLTQEGWRAPAARSSVWMERQRDKVVRGIESLEMRIAPWLDEDLHGQLANIASGAALGFVSFWMPELDWKGASPRLAGLCSALETQPHWQQTRPFLAPGTRFPGL
jgi:glutathione S-transferase